MPAYWADLPVRVKAVKPPKFPPVIATLARLDEFQRLLGTGEARNRADLAKRFGLSRARITQVMKLLDLPEGVAQAVRLGRGPNGERALRQIVHENQRGQRPKAFFTRSPSPGEIDVDERDRPS